MKKSPALLLVLAIFILNCGSAVPGSGSSSNDADDSSGTTTTGTDTQENSFDLAGLQLKLPYTAGDTQSVGQAFGGSFSHNDTCNYHAVDFSFEEGTDILSVAPGRVVYVKEDSNTGGVGEEYRGQANTVIIDHGNGYYGMYLHLCHECVAVEQGDTVAQGDVIGQSGNTGFSSAPHLHFQLNSWSTDCSVEYNFIELSSVNQTLEEGGEYISDNDGTGAATYTASVIPADRFLDNGVTLDSGFDWTLDAGGTLSVTGSVSDGMTKVFFFIFDGEGNTLESQTSTPDADGNFTLTHQSELEPGLYYAAFVASTTNSAYTEYSVYFLIE